MYFILFSNLDKKEVSLAVICKQLTVIQLMCFEKHISCSSTVFAFDKRFRVTTSLHVDSVTR